MDRVCLRDQMEQKLTELIWDMEKTAAPSTTSTVMNQNITEWVKQLQDVRYYVQSTESPEK